MQTSKLVMMQVEATAAGSKASAADSVPQARAPGACPGQIEVQSLNSLGRVPTLCELSVEQG